MDAESILKEVKSTLEDGITYLKGVYYGGVETNYASNFPLVYLEPADNIREYVEGYKENTFGLLIGGAIRVHNPELQIIGDADFKGIMDLEKDIKTALTAEEPDLGCNCISFTLSTIDYGVNKKVRWCTIRAEFKYKE